LIYQQGEKCSAKYLGRDTMSPIVLGAFDDFCSTLEILGDYIFEKNTPVKSDIL
jgi:hypothetical protein